MQLNAAALLAQQPWRNPAQATDSQCGMLIGEDHQQCSSTQQHTGRNAAATPGAAGLCAGQQTSSQPKLKNPGLLSSIPHPSTALRGQRPYQPSSTALENVPQASKAPVRRTKALVQQRMKRRADQLGSNTAASAGQQLCVPARAAQARQMGLQPRPAGDNPIQLHSATLSIDEHGQSQLEYQHLSGQMHVGSSSQQGFSRSLRCGRPASKCARLAATEIRTICIDIDSDGMDSQPETSYSDGSELPLSSGFFSTSQHTSSSSLPDSTGGSRRYSCSYQQRPSSPSSACHTIDITASEVSDLQSDDGKQLPGNVDHSQPLRVPGHRRTSNIQHRKEPPQQFSSYCDQSVMIANSSSSRLSSEVNTAGLTSSESSNYSLVTSSDTSRSSSSIPSAATQPDDSSRDPNYHPGSPRHSNASDTWRPWGSTCKDHPAVTLSDHPVGSYVCSGLSGSDSVNFTTAQSQQPRRQLSLLVLELFSGTAPVGHECVNMNTNPNSSTRAVAYLALELDPQLAADTPTASDMGLSPRYHKVICGDVCSNAVEHQVRNFVGTALSRLEIDCVVVFGGPPCQTFSMASAIRKPSHDDPNARAAYTKGVIKKRQEQGDPVAKAYLMVWDWTHGTARMYDIPAFVFIENPHSTNALGLRTRPYMRERWQTPELVDQQQRLRITFHHWCRYDPEGPPKLTDVFTNSRLLPKEHLCNCRDTVVGFSGSHIVTGLSQVGTVLRSAWPAGFVKRCLRYVEIEVREQLAE